MPISLLILVVFECVVRRKERAFCSREREKKSIGWAQMVCSAMSSQNAPPQLVIVGFRQELFCDLELSLLL